MLARLYRSRDKLEADFQQFYGLDLERAGTDYTIRHAAVLAANLPAESRCMREISADLEWSPEMHMMAVIEHDVRALIWTLVEINSTKPTHNKFPEPIESPAKRREVEKRLEHTDIDLINAKLGIRG